ncbi:class II aldolase/adducin family protein [Aliamphritea ceti]|uniref:class II aldolase/adducin family protein n=1 Tax=Aliamphritea ceti TaxID=1524258 RepID=UPI0021C3043E|nr:class II aldolase/adducin family protein [Aliamphritea ceti]
MQNNIEKKQRTDLAAAYNLLHHYGWSDQIFTHISVKLERSEATFLINQYGLLPEEINASNLLEIDLQGSKLNNTDADVNPAGFTIHSAIHSHCPNAHCVIHTHTMPGMAISAMEAGLLPVNQTNMAFYEKVSYYDYEGIPQDLTVRKRIVEAMGSNNCMILRNHGLLTTGRSVAEAFFYMYYLNAACEIQLNALSTGQPLTTPSIEHCRFTAEQFADPSYHDQSVKLFWDAQLRKLDRSASQFRN